VNGLRHFAPQAVRDVEDAADWLANSPGGTPLARRFLTAVIEAAERIGQRPLLGHQRTELFAGPVPLLARHRISLSADLQCGATCAGHSACSAHGARSGTVAG
jgi:plasmid stabilization system protein ParE